MLIEIFIIFIISFGIFNLIRFIFDVASKKEKLNDNFEAFALILIVTFILSFVFKISNSFTAIYTSNGRGKDIILFAPILISGFVAIVFWNYYEELIVDKILEKIMFHEKTPLSRPENEDTFLYFKFTDTSRSKSITGDKNTRKLFEKLINKKYSLDNLKNHYTFITDTLEIKIIESDKELVEIINNYGIYNSYLIKIVDGKISSLKEDFIKNLLDNNREEK